MNIILKSNNNKIQLQTALKNYFTKVFGAMLPESQIQTISEQLSIPWLTDFIKFDPQIALSKNQMSGSCP